MPGGLRQYKWHHPPGPPALEAGTTGCVLAGEFSPILWVSPRVTSPAGTGFTTGQVGGGASPVLLGAIPES